MCVTFIPLTYIVHNMRFEEGIMWVSWMMAYFVICYCYDIYSKTSHFCFGKLFINIFR